MIKVFTHLEEEKGSEWNVHDLVLYKGELSDIGNVGVDSRSETTSNSSIYNCENQIYGQKFYEGLEVLAQWSDGLFYLGAILEVDYSNQKCYIRFDDGSEFWILFQHLQSAQMQGSEILCAVCENGMSEPPNEIVLCDHCGLGYHQKCHNPVIGEEVLQPEVMWNCRGCVFATTAKKGGASKVGPHAQAMQEMKKTLPYELSTLKWDEEHKTNTEQCYCYCGGPGEWYVKMLQCCQCKQWFHEACIQCLEMPMLYGDRFYQFVCSVCCSGPEYIKRLDLDWVDASHLVMFNLTILHNRKYHDFDSYIIPFINGNWELLQMPKQYQKFSTSERKKNLLHAFDSDTNRFKCGKEVKKKNSLWSLRNKVPPPMPVIQLPKNFKDISKNGIKPGRKRSKSLSPVKKNRISDASSGSSIPEKISSFLEAQTDNSMENIPRRGRKKAAASQLPTSIKVKTIPQKRKRGRPSGSKNKKSNKMIITSKIKRKFNKYSTTRKKLKKPIFNDSTDDDNSSRGTLESIIPHPNNFHGSNNPFSTYNIPYQNQFNGIRTTKRKLCDADLCVKNGVVRLKRRTRSNKSPRSDATRSNGTSETSLDMNELDSHATLNHPLISEGVQTTSFTYDDLRSSVNSYFGASNRIANGEKYSVLAKRITADGQLQYLIQWENSAVA